MSYLGEYKRLLPFLRKNLLFYIPGLICLVVTDAGQIYIPQLTKKAVNLISSGEGSTGIILNITVIMVVIAVFIAAGRFGWRYFIGGTARRIESDLRQKLFRHLLGLSPGFYEKRRTGDIMSRFTNDMNAIRMACGMAVVSIVDGLFMATFILVILFRDYPGLAGWIAIPLPLLFILVVGAGRLLGRRSKLVQEGFSNLSAHTQETFAGIRVYKTFACEDFAAEKFKTANDIYLQRAMSLIRVWGFFFPLINFLSGVTSLLLLWFGGRQVIDGIISPGDFAAVLSYLGLLVWPMMGAGFTINWLERGGASLARIGEFLDEKPDIISGDGFDLKPAGDVEVRGLSYSRDFYNEKMEEIVSVPVLTDISFRLKQGHSLGILGRTGSGKTSLISLLPRLYEAPAGTVFIGGRDIREYELSELRKNVGVVMQDTFLFSETIKENIRFAVPDAGDELIREAADFSTISRDLKEFPFGWDTMVGERGHTLSGGQKQRVAISRAYLTNPEILIFDDCLSAVDSETEASIIRSFLEKRSGRTSIIISNRIGTLSHTDNIIVLEDGCITQQGTHEQLLSEKGLYRTIYNLQQAENGR